jgi:Sulfotransferase family
MSRAWFRVSAVASVTRAVQRFTQPPIVIGGCARSGTTLLLSVLSCHSRIFAIEKETNTLATAKRNREPGTFRPRPLKLDRLARQLEKAKARAPSSCHRWCEKSPKNVLSFGAILEAFGKNVRLIHMVRDGRDVVTSIHPGSPGRFWVTKDRWVLDVSVGLAFADHPQVLTVKYEDLTHNYPAAIATICDFLDEEVEPSFFAYPDAATIKTSGAWLSPALPVHSESIERWKAPQYTAVIDDFMRDLRAVQLLQRLGYLPTPEA